MHGEPFICFPEQLREWKGLRVLWDCNKGLYPLDYSLWYIRDLIVFIVFSPLILAILKKLTWIVIALLAGLFLTLDSFHFLGGLLFYSFGCYLRICGKSILDVSRSVKWPALAASCLLLPAIVLTYRDYRPVSNLLMRVFILCGVFSLFCVVAGAYQKQIIKDTPLLTRSSFFIFAAHGILILNEFAHFIVLHTLPAQGDTYYSIDLFLRPALAIVMCIGLYWIMSKITPRTLSILTGGRTTLKATSA